MHHRDERRRQRHGEPVLDAVVQQPVEDADRRGCLRRDADMDAGMLVNDPRLVVEQCIQPRLLRDRRHHRAHQEWQQREPRLLLALSPVQRLPQLFQCRDIDLFDVGDMRDACVRHRHLLGDPAPQPDHLDVFDRALRLKRLRPHHAGIAGGKGVEVFVRDAAGRPSARYLTQVDARLSRAEANRRRRHRPDRTGACRCPPGWLRLSGLCRTRRRVSGT